MLINDHRALAYNAKITNIRPIEGADNIELVGVNGWTCIAKKGEFQEGDPCIYFEIDSRVPPVEPFEFLANKGFKIKTMKLSKFGVFSQGLALPIEVFPMAKQDEIIKAMHENKYETTDLTEILGVKYIEEEDNRRKAEPNPEMKYTAMKARHKKFFSNPIIKKLMKHKWFRKFMYFFLGKKKKDNAKAFPTHFPYVHKTDEDRAENLPWVLEYERPLVVTEKLDGTSCTYILERKKFGKFEFYVTSRNVRMLSPDQDCYHESNIYWELAQKYHIEEAMQRMLAHHPEWNYVCIQGEGVGNVQGNPLKLEENDLYVFNFITSDVGRWPSVKGRDYLEQYGFKWVPILDENFMMPNDMETFKFIATAPSVVNPGVLREGIVLRDPTNDFSFKNVSREYLLKHNI